MIVCCASADLGIGTCAESAGQLATHVELDVCVTHQQGLSVGVDRDELDSLESLFDHAVDRVHAAAADADDLDYGEVVVRGASWALAFRGLLREMWKTLNLNHRLRVMSSTELVETLFIADDYRH